MGRIIRLRKESWFTRLWWGMWRWMRPQQLQGPVTEEQAEVPKIPPWAKSQMQRQLLQSQRRVVDELHRLNQILARTGGSMAPGPRTPASRKDRKVRPLFPRLQPKTE